MTDIITPRDPIISISPTPTCLSPSQSPRSFSKPPHLSPSLIVSKHEHTHSHVSTASSTTTSIATTTTSSPEVRSRETSLSASQSSSIHDEKSISSSPIITNKLILTPQLLSSLVSQPIISHSQHLRTLTHIPPFLLSSYIHSQTQDHEQYQELCVLQQERKRLEYELQQLRDAIPTHMAAQQIIQYCSPEDPLEEAARLELERKKVEACCTIM